MNFDEKVRRAEAEEQARRRTEEIRAAQEVARLRPQVRPQYRRRSWLIRLITRRRARRLLNSTIPERIGLERVPRPDLDYQSEVVTIHPGNESWGLLDMDVMLSVLKDGLPPEYELSVSVPMMGDFTCWCSYRISIKW